ncbi:TPA: hypothetical protein DCE37_24995 [Candidatus Latescibacteria bacterium]|nr:hypothetical protein [Candidatus Latescibacterota bacterium]
MFRKLFAVALTAGVLGTGMANAQDLDPFPVDRIRESPETDLITTARLTTTSFGFVKLTTNARAVAMGDAYSAVGNDLSSIFYNPAGITQLETERAVLGGYSKWIVGSSLGTFALGIKTSVATFGVSAIYFQTEEFEERTSQNPAGTGRMVRGSDIAVGFTIAKQLTDKLSFGGQIRYIKEDLDLIDFTTVDVNFGTVFFTGYRSTRLAMSLRNLGSDKEVVAQKARVPTVFYLSGAGEIAGNLGDPFSLTVAVEQAFFTDYAARYYFGAEAWINNMLALRAGYKTRHDSESWSVGAGLKQDIGSQSLSVDIAFSHASEFDENPVRLTVGYGF